MTCSIASTVYYYNVYSTTKYRYDDDYIYNNDWEDYRICRVSVVFFNVATTYNFIAVVLALELRRRLALCATPAPLIYGHGNTTIVTFVDQGYQQPQQPGYYQPSYPGQMPPPPSCEQKGQMSFKFKQGASVLPPSYSAGAPSIKM